MIDVRTGPLAGFDDDVLTGTFGGADIVAGAATITDAVLAGATSVAGMGLIGLFAVVAGLAAAVLGLSEDVGMLVLAGTEAAVGAAAVVAVVSVPFALAMLALAELVALATLLVLAALAGVASPAHTWLSTITLQAIIR